MNITVHRGTHQIGGSITELSTGRTHLFVDFGSELPGSEPSSDGRMVAMLREASCDAVLFSHCHGDHVGLLDAIPERDASGKPIRLYMGRTARQMLDTVHSTLLASGTLPEEERIKHGKICAILRDSERCLPLDSGRSFTVGDITVTPLRVDHSAYDAYLFVFEAEGVTVVHTGDFRAHGRLGKRLFVELAELLRGKTVSALITEGTMLSRRGEAVLSEEALEERALALLKRPENRCAFLLCSSTNMESLASFANAAMALGRVFYVNRYVYQQILTYRDSAGRENAAFRFRKTYPLEDMRRFNPKLGMTQSDYMRAHGFLMLLGVSAGYKKWIERFRDEDPLLIYSLWSGYTDRSSESYDERLGTLYHSWPPERRIDLHTSGHAAAEDLRRMILTVRPQRAILPIHTQRPEAFSALGIGEYAEKVLTINDGDTVVV